MSCAQRGCRVNTFGCARSFAFAARLSTMARIFSHGSKGYELSALTGIQRTHTCVKIRYATPLLMCLVCIELSDFVFAVDSIPAVSSKS
jgi:predicted tellurium resistance membrane protein TerC